MMREENLGIVVARDFILIGHVAYSKQTKHNQLPPASATTKWKMTSGSTNSVDEARGARQCAWHCVVSMSITV